MAPPPDTFGSVISGLLTFSASILSLYLIWSHLHNFSKPKFQRRIVRILFMVPVYAFSAWLTYLRPDLELGFELVRSCYEAFVIYEFFGLLMAYLGDGMLERQRLLSNKQKRHLLPPFCCVYFYPASPLFLMDIKMLILQYVVVRPVTTIVALVSEWLHSFHGESLDPQYFHFWFTLMNFVSTSVAMYSLVLFFYVIRDDITAYRPLTKFLSVKFVVFMTFWQSLIIGALSRFSLIPNSQYWDRDHTGVRVQSLLFCLEMFVASIWHMSDRCFGCGDFRMSLHDKTSVWNSLRQCFDPRDTLEDIQQGAVHFSNRATLRHLHHNPVQQSDDIEASISDVATTTTAAMEENHSIYQLDNDTSE